MDTTMKMYCEDMEAVKLSIKRAADYARSMGLMLWDVQISEPGGYMTRFGKHIPYIVSIEILTVESAVGLTNSYKKVVDDIPF